MADPAYYQSRALTSEIQQKEHLFHLYLHQGHTYMTKADWKVYDGPGSNAELVASAHGHHVCYDTTLYFISLAFTDQRFNESSLKLFGEIGDEQGECAIIGGTGEFVNAQGVVTFKKIQETDGNLPVIKELHVRALSLTVLPSISNPAPPTNPKPVEAQISPNFVVTPKSKHPSSASLEPRVPPPYPSWTT